MCRVRFLTVVSAHNACVCRGCPCALFCLYALVAHAVTFGITCVCTTRRCPNMSGLCSVILVLLLNISQVSAICASRLSCALSSVFVCPHALLVKCTCGCSWCRCLPCVRVVYVLPRCMAVYGIVCAHAFVCLVYLYCFFVENTHFGSVNLFKIHRSFQNYHGLENRTVGC